MGKIFYLPHGGGPLPLLGDPAYARLAQMLRSLNAEVAGSRAIIVVTAHWEADRPSLTSADKPGMLYDYYGFPEVSYQIEYPAPGAPELARSVGAALTEAGFAPLFDAERGFDHGVFVPMILIRPEADIPILQMSLLSSLDPAQHLALGSALAGALQDEVTLIGSGFSFHNMGALRAPGQDSQGLANAFHQWMDGVVCSPDCRPEDRSDALTAWAQAPGARFCHPREEHLLPLHVCCGAALACGMPAATRIFGEPVKSYQTSGYRWQH